MKRICLFLVYIIALFFCSCDIGSESSNEEKVNITSCGFSESSVNLTVGEIKQVLFKIVPSSLYGKVKVSYSVSDSSSDIVSLSEQTSNGLIVTALKSGNCVIVAKCENFTSYLQVNITGSEEDSLPYIVTPFVVWEMTNGSKKSFSVSLYNGSSTDNELFEFQSSNPEIISIDSTSNTIVCNSLAVGKSTITITHPKAKLPTSVIIYSTRVDITPCYITTSQNVVQTGIEEGTKNIQVNLVGSKRNDISLFTFNIIEGKDIFDLVYNNNVCSITPKNKGVGIIEVSHPESEITLQIQIVVVKTTVEAYITSDNNFLVLGKSKSSIVTCSIVGGSSNDFSDFTFELSKEGIIKVDRINNAFYIESLSDGNVKIIVKNSSCANPHEIYVIVDGFNGELENYYISTSQNIIRMEKGEEKTLSMLLVGGNESDGNNFTWKVEDSAVIDVVSNYGNISYERSSNITSSLSVDALITAKQVGESYIELSNPKTSVPSKVLVKVYRKGSLLNNYVTALGEGLIKLIKGNDTSYSINLSESVDSDIQWSCEPESLCSITGNSENVLLRGEESGIGGIKADNERFLRPYSAVVVSGTEEEIASYNVLYVDNSYPEIYKGIPVFIEIKTSNSISDEEGYTVSISDVSVVDARMSQNVLILNGLKSGTCELSLKHGECNNTLKLYVTVNDEVSVDKPYYFEYEKFMGIVVGQTGELSVTLKGSSEKDLSGINWYTEEGQDVISITGNGDNCRIKALKEGETYLYASSLKSSNIAKIYIYTALTEEELKSKVIISSDTTNYLSYIGNDIYVKVYVTDEENNREKIQWSVDDISVCKIDANYDDAYIRCLSEGNAVVTVSCGSAALKIFVSVKETKEEMEEKDIVVPSIIEKLNGSSYTVESVCTGLTESEISKISWSSSDESVCKVVGNGSLCYMTFIGSGTNYCEVVVKLVDYGIEKRIQIITADTISELEECVIMSLPKGYYAIKTGDEISLNLEFGTKKPSDEIKSKIKWENSDNSVANISSNGSNCSVVGINEGFSIVKISGEGIVNTLSIKIACSDESEILDGYYISVEKKMYGILNGNSEEVTVNLYDGKGNLVNGSLSDFDFEVSNSEIIDVVRVDNIFSITAKKSGSSYIKISHPLANSISILIYTAETESELSSLYPITTDKNHYLINVGSSAILSINTIDDTLIDGLKWSISDSTIISYTVGVNKKSITVKGKKSGICKITVSHEKSPVDVEFSVSVTEYGTQSNVVILTESIVQVLKGKDIDTSVKTNLGSEEENKLVWKSSNENVASVISEGCVGHITGIEKGICEITVRYSSTVYRTLICYVGESQNDIDESKCINIDKRYNVIGIEESITFTPFFGKKIASIVNTKIEDVYKNEVVKYSEKDGKYTFTGIEEGIACYRFSNSEVSNVFEIYIEVNRKASGSIEETITGYLTSTKMVYLLDSKDKATPAMLTVSPINMEESLYPGLEWKSSNENVCTAIGNGTSCKVYANNIGETTVICSSVYSSNLLTFRIIVSSNVDGNIAYIKATSNTIEVPAGDSYEVTCTIENIESYDVTKFNYNIEDSSICSITQLGNVFKIKGINQGQTNVKIGYNSEEIEDINLVVSVNGVSDNIIYLTTDNNYTIMSEKSYQTLGVELVGFEETNGNNFYWEVVGEKPVEEGKKVINLSGSGKSRLCTSESTGTATIRVTHINGEQSALYPLYLTVKVTEYEETNPIYIKTETNVVTVEEGSRVTLDVDLKNGDESTYSQFKWGCSESDVVEYNSAGKQCVVKGLIGGRTCKISVSHPDAGGQILDIIVIVEKKAQEDELHIATDSTVIEMKPTDSYRQINVNLVGGSALQNTLFSWEILSHDSIERNSDGTTKNVISITGSQDSCLVTAKNEGMAIIRVKNSATSHYLDIKIIVSLFSNLSFSESSLTLMQSESSSVKVSAPTGKIVIYESSNSEICTVTGTNKVCMIDAIGIGTCVIRGYTSDGLCEDEIVVKVNKNTEINPIFITVSNNILTLNTLNDLNGITVTCKVNNVSNQTLESSKVVWKTGSGTTNVFKIVNTDPTTVTDSSCTVVPVSGGTDVLYLNYVDSNEKVYSKTIYVQVEENEAILTLNPSYVSFSKGDSTTINCSLSGVSETELTNINWSSSDNTICKILDSGNGTSCTIKAVGNGETTVACNYAGKVVKYVSIFVQDSYSISIPNGSKTVALGQKAYVQVYVTPNEDTSYSGDEIKVNSSSSIYLDVSTKLEKMGDSWYIPITGTSIAGITTITCTYHNLTAKVNITTTSEVSMKLLNYTEIFKDGTTQTVLSPLNIYGQCDSQKIKAYYTVYPYGLTFDQKDEEVMVGSNNYEYYTDMIRPDKNVVLYSIRFGEDEGGTYFEIIPKSCFYGDLIFGNNDSGLKFKFPICITYKDFSPKLIFSKNYATGKSSYDEYNGILNLSSKYGNETEYEKVNFTLDTLPAGMQVYIDSSSFRDDKLVYSSISGNTITYGNYSQAISGNRIDVKYITTMMFCIKYPKYCGVNGTYYLSILVNNNIYN